MKTYKVIKDFGNAKKGDLFKEVEGENVYIMERIEGEGNVSDNGEHYMKSWVSMELSEEIAEAYCRAGLLIEEKENDDSNSELDSVKEYINCLLDTYENDHKEMLEAFDNGEVQPCVKVEAETVYYNLMKVLNSIKDKIDE